jgi:sigma-B regulation protein RsbU (phosphoserine phosphatase)
MHDSKSAATLGASRVEKYQVLLSVAQELTSILDLDRLLNRVGHLIQEVLPHELFAILLYDEERQELVWKAGIGYSDESFERVHRFPVTQGLVGRAVRLRRPAVSGDVSREPDYLVVTSASGEIPRSELAVPLIYKDKVVGAMSVECTRPDCFTAEDEELLTALGSLVAVAIVNAALYEASQRDAATKELLYEVARELSSILDLEELLEHIAEQVKRVIDYKIFAIYLVDPATQDLILKTTRGFSAETIRRLSRVPPGQGLLGRSIAQRRSFIVEDVSKEPDYLPKETVDGTRVRSLMNVPLLVKDKALGVLSLETVGREALIPEHLRIMDILASEIAVAIENARLYEELVTRERKLENDLQLARRLQLSMLPEEPPRIPGFEIGTAYMPAENLGGDYYDFVRLGPVRTGIVIADVCGKGVAAAMTMAASHSAVRSAAETEDSPGAVLRLANRRLCRETRRHAYVTLCYGVLDPARGTFTYTSAGHYPPLCVRENGEISYLNAGGTVLGMFDGAAFPEETIELSSGDLICFYTDGVVDAFDRKDEMYGEGRLERQLLGSHRLPAQEIARRIVESVEEHSRGREQHDDLTIIVLKSI